MKYEEIKRFLNKLFPSYLTLKPENYGIHINHQIRNKNINKILLSLDLSFETLYFAIQKKIDFIISLSGLFKRRISNINEILSKKLKIFSKFPVSVFILNSAFLVSEGGVLDTLLDVLLLRLEKPLFLKNYKKKLVPIGKICSPLFYPNENNSLNLEKLLKRIKNNLNISNVLYLGSLDMKIKRILILGDGLNNEFIFKSSNFNYDCCISMNFKNLNRILADDLGISIIFIPRILCEYITLKKLNNILSLEFPNTEFYILDLKKYFYIYT